MNTDTATATAPEALPKILYVDDEPENLFAFKATYRTSFAVFTAPSAQEGLSMLRHHPDICVVIADNRMPLISGLDMLKSVAQEFPEMIRVVMTAFTDVEAVIEAINSGAVYRYVTKPWDPDELKSSVDSAVNYYNLQAENARLLRHLEEYNRELERRVEERTRELAGANQRLMMLNEEKNEFLGIAAHDLKNPLASIVMTASTIRSYGNRMTMDQMLAMVEKMQTTAKRMTDIVTNLLDVNAIDSGYRDIRRQDISLESLLDDVVQEYNTRAQPKNISIVRRGDLLPMLHSNAQAVTEILENLLSNAVKYSPHGAKVTVASSVQNSFASVSVQDEGPGLSDDDRERLFQRFARLSAKPTGGEHSTGLGLYIVKRLTEMLGGTVVCNSEPGKGAEFTVSFPL